MSRAGLAAAVVVAGVTVTVPWALAWRGPLVGWLNLLLLVLLWGLLWRSARRSWAMVHGRGSYSSAMARTRLVYRSRRDGAAVLDVDLADLYAMARYGGGKLLSMTDASRGRGGLYELVVIPPSGVDIDA